VRSCSRSRSAARSHPERGAALVEFAIAVPLLVLLMTAVIDFGVNVGNRVQVAHAAREGARAGSVNRVGENSSCTLDPVGTLATETRRLMCMTKERTRMDPDQVAVKVLYMGRNGKLTTDFSEATVATNPYSVVVCVAAEQYSLTGLLGGVFNGRFHHSRAVTKTGRPADGVFVPPGEEQPLSAGGETDDWSWCTADDPVGTE